ncbi:hypothetical protein Tco_1447494 [Tanacetum coccineum]
MKFVCSKKDDGEVMFIEIIRDDDEPQNEGPYKGEGATMKGSAVESFDTFPTRDELTYHKYLMCGPIPSIFLRNPIIMEGFPSNLKITCNIRHVHVEKSYIDLNSPLNIMTRMMYNWIMRRKLNPREDVNRGVSNFIGRIKGMYVFVGYFTYIVDFMIIEDISSIIDLRLSQVVLGKPFVEISNMTHDPQEGVVRFTNGNDEVSYKMPHKIEQYNSLSSLEREHTKPVYLKNEEDKRRGVEYMESFATREYPSLIQTFFQNTLLAGYSCGMRTELYIGSGSGGCGDDEPGDDEDGGEDEDDEEDADTLSWATCRLGKPSTMALHCLTKTMWVRQCHRGISPEKESPSSFPLQLILGDKSPEISIPMDKSPGNP